MNIPIEQRQVAGSALLAGSWDAWDETSHTEDGTVVKPGQGEAHRERAER